MRIALVLMFADGELPFLKLHLPVSSSSFDGIVALTDPKCQDGSVEYMRSLGVDVFCESWSYDWGQFATSLFNHAEALGYDAAMRLDPDEALMPDAGHEVKRLLENEAALLCFPRYEFFGDRLRVRTDLFPDYQARAWALGRGITVQGKRHEGVDLTTNGLSEHSVDPNRRVLRVESPVIYHYGWLGREGIWRNQVKYQRHAQVSAGGPEHVAFPPDTPLVRFPTVPFTENQPVDPYEVGAIAPWSNQ
jgi:hypothetical protein